MKKLPWMALGLVFLTALLVPLACDAQQATELQDYAQREAQAAALEDFEGGHAGVVLAVVVIAAVVALVALIIPW
jgi:hypothetical protein